MTVCSQEIDVKLNILLDKQDNGLAIEQLVKDGASYLEATTHWMEENSIPPTQYNKYIPAAIVDKITQEAIDNNEFRPTLARTFQTSTLDLDFL
ncbi:late transcriptional regulator [Providencia phage PSTRCR_127]|nr:late transcriptional regulator [Providencia phage PSTRCR_127]QQV89111.1 late transcriptional regulator [Providencia phage PSTRCR_121]UGO50285.1 putative late promoter transcription accessory [Morganella phage vB_MmoM_Rgz1]